MALVQCDSFKLWPIVEQDIHSKHPEGEIWGVLREKSDPCTFILAVLCAVSWNIEMYYIGTQLYLEIKCLRNKAR